MKIKCRHCGEIKKIRIISTNCLCDECFELYSDLYDSLRMGIYKLESSVNGIYYIGSTKYFDKRLASHISSLRSNCHGNAYLQRAWNKSGEDNFVFSIVEIVNDLEKLLDTEQKYFDPLIPFDHAIVYNICETAWGGGEFGEKNGMYGKHHSEETCKQMSESRTGELNHFYGKHHTDESRKLLSVVKGTAILQIDLDGNIIKRWDSAKQAWKESDGFFQDAHIDECLNKKYKTHNDYIWVKEEEYNQYYEKGNIEALLFADWVIQSDLEGNFVARFQTPWKAHIDSDEQFNAISITKRIEGKAKSNEYKGFKWLYGKDYYNKEFVYIVSIRKPMSEEHKKKIGESQRGELNHNYGKKASKETRKKMSEAQIGILNHNYKSKDLNKNQAI